MTGYVGGLLAASMQKPTQVVISGDHEFCWGWRVGYGKCFNTSVPIISAYNSSHVALSLLSFLFYRLLLAMLVLLMVTSNMGGSHLSQTVTRFPTCQARYRAAKRYVPTSGSSTRHIDDAAT